MISLGGANSTSPVNKIEKKYNADSWNSSLCENVETLKFKLIIAYDGTAYEGWQVQKIGTGVQQIVETALAKLFPSAPQLHSSSRTDTGVHALGMVAHFEVPVATTHRRPAEHWRRARRGGAK